ncbi:HipA N-terminal domain-containing protein [Myroides odoratimimus]|uniref:HipA domain-containing protein n=1 Tax=Myroides odoratimimus CIP 101113 TaxID=883154 RepID=A0AAV3F2F5_9FLAO|nr:HipA N-terminal domain-containing protein [Myroides odoratimimus]EHO10483.1 HipA domain-containing protein [Myroides odoratimimus CIP 101113]EPH13027.1 serine/threonine-protein kinase HipA [Myroides odoratimimus CCUG 12700]MCS7475100.1 HipA N-terminal domain-containing protein [Myroides odoratimimus]MDX4975476.1 HipA N-terminal domain-containing protein [Myroides odoratimimus]
MVRQAKIYFQDQLAGYLLETDNGYSFYYEKNYLKTTNPKPISLPLSEENYHSNVLFPFFDGLIPEGWLLDIGEKHWKLNPHDRSELLINLCRDTIGAVSVYPMEAENHE